MIMLFVLPFRRFLTARLQHGALAENGIAGSTKAKTY